MGQIIAIGFNFKGCSLNANVIKLSNGLETEYHVNILRDKFQGIRAQNFILEVIDGKISLQDGNAFHDHELIRAFITKIEEHENLKVT
jgi:hypothetical protein